MSLIKKRARRSAPEIPLASMADLSFLLLIFFLVTTTIDVDTGISMTLPAKLEADQSPPPVNERNLLKIGIDARGEVSIDERPARVGDVRAEVMKHVTNRGQDADYAESPDRAVVSLKTERETAYDAYIAVLDEVWMAYFTLWNEEAQVMGFPSYERYRQSLDDESQNVIRARIKPQISIAEPEPSPAAD